jgi:formylglycine-generating enzyme required for sulfatase activity
VTIDRAATVALPTDGVRVVKITLGVDCVGVPPSFLAPRTTCIDKASKSAAFTDGVEELPSADLPPSRVGTWPDARERPCATAPSADRICIPGGVSVLGAPDLAGMVETSDHDPVPLHVVSISPFYLDRTEYTVKRFRDHFAQIVGPPPIVRNPSDVLRTYCTWLGPNDASHDDLPVTCVPWETARAACMLEGGTLPTEAQWEHAARGRGQGWRYPWGNDPVSCCRASLSRESGLPVHAECSGAGPEPVGSHQANGTCGGDVSRDGVLDLGGSVGEVVLDSFEAYTGPCWAGLGILADPLCNGPASTEHSRRGGDWSSGVLIASAAFRQETPSVGANSEGFRCAYPVSP